MQKKRKMRRLAAVLLPALLLATGIPAVPAGTVNAEGAQIMTRNTANEQLYRVWFEEPAPNRFPNTTNHPGVHGRDRDWEFLSLPIGNGFMGATIFGRTDTERISISENTLFNPNSAGLNAFMTFYLDFGHEWSQVTDYFRELVLNDAVATVQYTHNGITFTREHIASHPDAVTAIRLTAHDAATGAPAPGALNVTLRPAVPFVRPEGFMWANARGKSATVEANPATGTIRLHGSMQNWGLNYEGQVRVLNQGGNVTRHDWRFNPNYSSSIEGVGTLLEPNFYPANPDHPAHTERGRGEAYDAQGLRVEGADEIMILVAVGTNYRMHCPDWRENEWANVFRAAHESQDWPGNQDTLDRDYFPYARVSQIIADASARSWDAILADHIADHRNFFDRARLNLGGRPEDAFNMTTTERLNRYRRLVGRAIFDPAAATVMGGMQSADPGFTFDPYFEELFFQFGRYLLIASSRENTMPAHLQGIWTAYEHTPWSGGWWHNINLQMNYWPAFNTNLADLFQSYADFNMAFRNAAQRNADHYLAMNAGPTAQPGLDPRLTGPVGRYVNPPGEGRNGWAIGTGVWPFRVDSPNFTTHSGPGTGGMTTSLFWEYWDFTRDLDVLENVTWPAVEGMAQFLMRTLRWCEEEELYLVWFSASPELLWTNPVTQQRGYYRTIGTLFDQQMVYDVYRTTIAAANILRDAGINPASHPIDWDFINQISREITLLAPVIIGRSGQVKEFREEEFYGEITDDWPHRHISHLLGLYPGTVLNSTTPHWFDAARVTLDYRGDFGTGWAIGHKLNFWARMADGNRAYSLLRNMLGTSVGPNMWGQHEPFQIDANFGGISGMAEMLVQSHEGFISLLPARPDIWPDGSFEGLTARGGFEVDARWANHQAQQFVIHSNRGEEAVVKFYNITSATVTASDGSTVQISTQHDVPGVADTDMISFPTVAGVSYTITGIPPFTPTAPPTNLQLESVAGPAVNLTWTASPGAASYRVYVARDSEPVYTYVGTATTTAFTHQVAAGTQGSQFTYRVTAVAANGRASSGITALIIPARPPASAEGRFEGADGTTLVVTVAPETSSDRPGIPEANNPGGGTPTQVPVPSRFRLYERVGGELVFRTDAAGTTITLPDGNTASDAQFYVRGYDSVTGGSAHIPVGEVSHPAREGLRALVAEAERRDAEHYTAASWGGFATALAETRAVLEASGTPQIYTQAHQALQAATGALVADPRGMARANLRAAVAEGDAREMRRYTAASRGPFEAALASARTTLANDAAAEAEFVAATHALRNAEGTLVNATPTQVPGAPLTIVNAHIDDSMGVNVGGAYFNQITPGGWMRVENLDFSGGVGGFGFAYNSPYSLGSVDFELVFTRDDVEIRIPFAHTTVNPTGEGWEGANANTVTLEQTIPEPHRLEGAGWTFEFRFNNWVGHGFNVRYLNLNRVELVWPE